MGRQVAVKEYSLESRGNTWVTERAGKYHVFEWGICKQGLRGWVNFGGARPQTIYLVFSRDPHPEAFEISYHRVWGLHLGGNRAPSIYYWFENTIRANKKAGRKYVRIEW
jgi:hypothetical protein